MGEVLHLADTLRVEAFLEDISRMILAVYGLRNQTAMEFKVTMDCLRAGCLEAKGVDIEGKLEVGTIAALQHEQNPDTPCWVPVLVLSTRAEPWATVHLPQLIHAPLCALIARRFRLLYPTDLQFYFPKSGSETHPYAG